LHEIVAEAVRRPFRAAVGCAAWVALALAGCGKRTPPSTSAAAVRGSEVAGSGEFEDDGGAELPTDPREVDAWARAEQGGDEDRMRLVDLVGCDRLREQAARPKLRATAIQSMAYCRDFSALPWLAGVAASARGNEGIDALDAIVEQAARPRKSTDPDDADELADGCHRLLALSRAPQQPRARRVRAIRALRMLAERGCVNRADIPTDLDAR
jgi:hypothetical protein